jgi:hypothetical protein
MSRPSISDTPMTGAERQARYRAAHADGAPVVRVRRPADRRSRIQRWRDAVSTLTNLQAEYARWLKALPDRTISKTAPWRRRYRRLSNSTSRSFRRSNHHGVSAVIDQPHRPTGTTGKGHEDACWGDRLQPVTA